MYLGPNSPVESGSITGELEALVSYTLKVITKMQIDNIRYFVPKQDVTDEFNEHTQSWFKGTVWEEDCNAWCKYQSGKPSHTARLTRYRQEQKDWTRRCHLAWKRPPLPGRYGAAPLGRHGDQISWSGRYIPSYFGGLS